MIFQRAFSGKPGLHIVIIAGLSFLILFYFVKFSADYFDNPERQFVKFQKNFIEQQNMLYERMESIEDILSANRNNYWPLLERSVDDNNIIAQVYWKDTLFFWNSRMITNEIARVNSSISDTVIFQKTGWYLLHRKQFNDYDIFLLKQIKAEYAYNNSFLPNTFDPDFSTAENIQLTHDLANADHIIYDRDGKNCLGLIITSDRKSSDSVILGLFLLFILFYLCIILLVDRLYNLAKELINNNITLFLFFVVDLILLRVIDHFTGFPWILKQSFLFAPSEIAISGLSTYGDLVLNALIISVIALKLKTILSKYPADKNQKKRPFTAILTAIFLFVLTGVLFYAIYEGLQTLEYNAFFGFLLLSKQGVIIIMGILLIVLALYLFTSSLIEQIKFISRPLIVYLVMFLILGIGSFYLLPDKRAIIIASVICTYGSLVISYYLPGRLKPQPLKLLLGIILFSSSCTIVVNQLKKDKKDIHQIQTAQLLSDSKDLTLESNYATVVGKIKNDTLVNDIILNYLDPEQNLSSYFQGTYFTELNDKYSLQVTVCEEGEVIVVNPGAQLYDCEEFFDFRIEELGITTATEGLYQIDDIPATIYYIGKIEMDSATGIESNWKIYLEFFYSYVPEGLGYTELLVDNSKTSLDLTHFSFAVYENGRLNNKFGNFAYNLRFDFLENYHNKVFFNLMGHRHTKIEVGEDKYLIVSRPLEKVSEMLVVFSGLFLLFLLFTFLYFSALLFRGSDSLIQLSFRNRLQLIFVSTISLIIAILAIITLFYAEADNERKTIEQLNEKTISVLIELEYKLSNINSLEQFDREELQLMLEKFSSVFFSDINLYSPSGQLIATSRRDIFNKGLLSENINPMAYEELFVKNRLSYVTSEMIGTADYYSSYAPLNLNDYQAAGIVNLPYFAKQSEVTRSYYLMLFTFINMFVILGIAGTLLALLLSRALTRPLLLLQESLRSLQIDKVNERLEWGKNDEIGQLISEYNRMVEKLEQSAELMKHSERESAWREVAQQIAHEIKNPLTPMKLNVQYLEKAYQADDPKIKDKIHSISATLISQIDSLNQVAEMFSNFAKTNAGNLENVDLQKVIGSSVTLFKNQPGLSITVKPVEHNKSFFTMGIEKDLLRVFNNLIKNAIQSMEDMPDKRIEISLEKKEGFIIVLVSDNGKGIPHEAKQNIFKPYFTTKSGGTGLGLAITRNIMNEIGGEINFEERPEGGTTFVLYFRQLS